MSSHPSPLAFRADHVGSLLRPPAVKDAHLAYAEEKLTLAERRATEDQAI
jgi:5-methyltetrahydropteroyltriglutamate--homocysteine methyltransferase